MIPAKLSNVNGYEYISRQQLESIFAIAFSPKPAPKPKSRLKKRSPMPASRPAPKRK